MGSAVFTFLGILAAAKEKSNHWIVSSSLVAGGLLFMIASFLAWRDKQLELLKAKLDLDEERSAKNAPDLGLELVPGGLALVNRGLDRDAYNIHMPPVKGLDCTLEAEFVPFFKRGAAMPLRVFCTKYGETSAWDGKPSAFEQPGKAAIETVVCLFLEFSDTQGAVTYVAEFHLVFHKLSGDTIRKIGLTVKPKRVSL
jgi:hypothetical protein